MSRSDAPSLRKSTSAGDFGRLGGNNHHAHANHHGNNRGAMQDHGNGNGVMMGRNGYVMGGLRPGGQPHRTRADNEGRMLRSRSQDRERMFMDRNRDRNMGASQSARSAAVSPTSASATPVSPTSIASVSPTGATCESPSDGESVWAAACRETVNSSSVSPAADCGRTDLSRVTERADLEKTGMLENKTGGEKGRAREEMMNYTEASDQVQEALS
jgi:hypothetical protein